MNSHSGASLCITMERGVGSKEDQRALAQTNCTNEITFIFFIFPLCPSVSSVLPPDHQGVPPQDAGAESRPHCNSCQLPGFIQHSWSGGQYHTQLHIHMPSFPPSKNHSFCAKLAACQLAHWPEEVRPRFSSVPPPVKLRDADEH